jgi:membrane carboxypeptidase/penicillin-binding protein PbpC
MQIFEALPTPANGVPSSDKDIHPLGSDPALPPRLVRFNLGTPGSRGPRSLSFFYPRRGAAIDSDAPTGAPIVMTLAAQGGKGPYTWRLSGERQTVTEDPTLRWSFATRGQFDVQVFDSTGAGAETSFWLN